jgi:hypothetical protein
VPGRPVGRDAHVVDGALLDLIAGRRAVELSAEPVDPGDRPAEQAEPGAESGERDRVRHVLQLTS